MAILLALFLAAAFPSSSKTSWMRPEAFRLTVGMSRVEAVRILREGGWTAKDGDSPDQLVVDYTSAKALTLDFRNHRLHSIRFELFAMIPEIRTAFTEEKEFLRKTLGAPKRLSSKSVLVYDGRLPNVMVVVDADPKSERGRQGLGMLVVRYYDPR